MGGIVAIFDPDAASGSHAGVGRRMLHRIRHRGPDGSGEHEVGAAWLGQVRLTIVDVGHSAEPATGPGRGAIVADGEIYQHRQISRANEPSPRTGSIPVPLLRSGADPGGDAALTAGLAAGLTGDLDRLAELRGMFAVAAADDGGAFGLVRDSLGIKPLYWARRGSVVYAASELCAFDADLRPAVEEFPPGHRWTPHDGLQRFGDLHPTGPPPGSREEARALIRRTLIDSVRRQMVADVPIGVFLSGGLDSSLVAAIMAREYGSHGRLHSFAAGTPGSSDLRAARRVAEHLGLEHHEIGYTDDDVVAALPEVVWSLESYEPSLVRSAVPNYLLAREAARTVTVVLSGEGADELFAGYHHLRQLADDGQLTEALVEGISGLHNLGLQRVDRMTMAHGLQARVPFLDHDMLALAARIPTEWLAPGSYGQEKALLREAFEGWLPEDMLWRPKEQFGDGSGTAEVMLRRAHDLVAEPGWNQQAVAGLPAPRSREELGYQRLFAERLDGIDPRVLGRFATP